MRRLVFNPAHDGSISTTYAYAYTGGCTVQVARDLRTDDDGQVIGEAVRIHVSAHSATLGSDSWSHMESGRGETLDDALTEAEHRMRERCPAAWEHYASAVLVGAEPADDVADTIPPAASQEVAA